MHCVHDSHIIIETCRCGHWRTEHRDTMLELATHAVRRAGGGACRRVGCHCEEFDFAGSITVHPDELDSETVPSAHGEMQCWR